MVVDQSQPHSDMLASSRDREQVADILKEAYGSGKLTPDEYNDLITGAYASRTHGDLSGLISRLLPVSRNGALTSGSYRWIREMVVDQSQPHSDMLASSRDREQVAAILKEADEGGELTEEEFGDLLARAYAARTYGDLSGLISRLPPVSRSSSETVDSSGAIGVRFPSAANSFGAARRLVTIAASLLPGEDRARFCEEYRSELWDLASAGATRRQQLGYAFRQLLRVAPLRAAVLSPQWRKTGP